MPRQRRIEQWSKWLTASDRVEARLRRHGKQVLSFSVQYMAEFGGRWLPVVRFDTAHGRPHMDILMPGGSRRRRDLEGMDNRETFTYALDDIGERWEFYRQRYRRMIVMRRAEQFRRNNELFKLFMEKVLDSEELMDQIPPKADLVFLPEDDPELAQANLRLAERLHRTGKNPLIVKMSRTPGARIVVSKVELLETA